MSEIAPTTVKVQYRNLEGYHVFTSEQVFGLYVASKSADRALDQLQPALETLLFRNYGVKCGLEPAAEFGEFIAHHREDRTGGRASALGERTYVVRKAA